MKVLKYLLVFCSVWVWGQSQIVASETMVFEPNEQSIALNQLYTQHFFFGNFGLKQLIHAVPINNQSVKTIEISAKGVDSSQPVMQLSYDDHGLLEEMKVFAAFFGESMTVKYVYKEGVLSEEQIQQHGETKTNRFYYKDDQMIVLTYKGILDLYKANGKVLLRNSYLDGQLLLNDRLKDGCRTTIYQKSPIHKVCFSNMNLKMPLSIEEFTQSQNKQGEMELLKDQTLRIEAINAQDYRIFNDEKEEYQLTLKTDGRVAEFSYNGNKSTKTPSINFIFNYINY